MFSQSAAVAKTSTIDLMQTQLLTLSRSQLAYRDRSIGRRLASKQKRSASTGYSAYTVAALVERLAYRTVDRTYACQVVTVLELWGSQCRGTWWLRKNASADIQYAMYPRPVARFDKLLKWFNLDTIPRIKQQACITYPPHLNYVTPLPVEIDFGAKNFLMCHCNLKGLASAAIGLSVGL